MTEHLTYSLSATQELQAKINNPRDCTTDDAIAAVLAFACYAVSFAFRGRQAEDALADFSESDP
jgi:hypothetical protein